MLYLCTQGALVGSTTALSIMTWICFRAQQAISTGELHFAVKEVSTIGCTYQFTASSSHMNISSFVSTMTTSTTPLLDEMRSTEPASEGFQIYHISYIWYTLVGSSICIIVSLVASYISGPNDPSKLNPQLLAPFVRKLIKKREHSMSTRSNNNTTSLTTSNNTSNTTETSFQVEETLK